MRPYLLAALLALPTVLLAQQQVLASSGTFIVPAGVTSITAELVGAGGNGAGNGGGGGGGGAYVRSTFGVTPGASISIVVGEGGSELATIVGGFGLLAGAGENANTVPGPQIGGGGAGGVAMGGQVNRNGGAGGGGYWTYFCGGGGGAAGSTANGGVGGNTIAYTGGNCLTPGGVAGMGGGTPAGNGGKGAGFTDNNCTVTDPGGNGVTYGGGGGGGNGIGSSVGVGGGGVCIITWNGTMGMTTVDPLATLQVVDPFTDRIIVRNATGLEHYELLDATGRILWKGMHIGSHDFAHLRAGTYVLRVYAGTTARTIKVIKQGT